MQQIVTVHRVQGTISHAGWFNQIKTKHPRKTGHVLSAHCALTTAPCERLNIIFHFPDAAGANACAEAAPDAKVAVNHIFI